MSGEKWSFTSISDLIATKSIYSLCSYQHTESFLYILLVMRKLHFFFNNEMTRNAANEAQPGKSVVRSSSTCVLLTGEELSHPMPLISSIRAGMGPECVLTP